MTSLPHRTLGGWRQDDGAAVEDRGSVDVLRHRGSWHVYLIIPGEREPLQTKAPQRLECMHDRAT